MKLEFGFSTAAKAIGIALGLLMIHWAGIQIYSTWCAPGDLMGFATSIFTVASPPCRALLTISTSVQEMYIMAWISMGVAFISFIGGIMNICFKEKTT